MLQMRVKLSTTVGCFLVAFLAGCATTPCVEGDKVLLDFIENGKTTKEMVRLKLGYRYRIYQGGKIITYQIAGNKGDGYCVVDTRVLGLSETDYSLVLVFDNENVLRKHSLVKIR